MNCTGEIYLFIVNVILTITRAWIRIIRLIIKSKNKSLTQEKNYRNETRDLFQIEIFHLNQKNSKNYSYHKISNKININSIGSGKKENFITTSTICLDK